MKVVLEWVPDVPPPTNEKWPRIFEELMTRPGEWALVRTYRPNTGSASRMARLIREGVYRKQPAGRWDAKSRLNQLYVCYLGPPTC